MSRPKQFQFQAMTTQCTVQCYGMTDRQFASLTSRIHSTVKDLVLIYNFHSTTSWLNRKVNARTKDRIKISSEFSQILKTVRHHCEIAGDVFDITVGTYSHRLKNVQSVTEAQAVKCAAQPWVGKQHWGVDGSYLHFSNPHTRLDLGGVIKEYAVDRCLLMAQASGASASLVNFGGDVRSFGCKPNGGRFVAAVSDPIEPKKILFALDLENQALTTSGHYARRKSFYDGELSHVLPNDDGSALTYEKNWSSVSVVAHSALVSGIYSTSLLLKPDASLASDIFAIAIDSDNQVFQLPTLPSKHYRHIHSQHNHSQHPIPEGGIPCV